MPPIRNNNFVNTLGTETVEVDALRVFLIVLAIMSVAVSAIFFVAGQFFNYRTQKSLEEISVIDQRLNTLPLSDMSAFSTKVSTVDTAQKDKNNITVLLAILSDSIEKYTYFTDMNFSDKAFKSGYVNIKGIAQSYEDIIKQTDRLKSNKYKPFIKSVSLTDLSATEKDGSNSIKFSLDLELDTKVKSLAFDISEKSYDASKKPIKITLNNNTANTATNTSTSSAQTNNVSTTTIIINKKP